MKILKGNIYLWLNIAVSITASYYFALKIINNTDALNLLVSTFSILTGFLFLIITVNSELAMPQRGMNIDELENQNHNFSVRSSKYMMLFIGYLSIVFLILIFYLLKDYHYHSNQYLLKEKLGYIIVFISCFMFISSLRLPFEMKKLAENKIQLRIKELNAIQQESLNKQEAAITEYLYKNRIKNNDE